MCVYDVEIYCDIYGEGKTARRKPDRELLFTCKRRRKKGTDEGWTSKCRLEGLGRVPNNSLAFVGWCENNTDKGSFTFFRSENYELY